MADLFHAMTKQHNPLGTLTRARGTGRYTFGLALSAGMAGLLYGYDTVSISGAIDFLRAHYGLSPALEGAIISSVMLGGIVGALAAGFLSDRFGRRRILMTGAALFFAASLLSAATMSAGQLLVARTVGGIGIGLTAALAVTYIIESAPTHIRGTLAFSYQMMAVCGIFLTNVINYVVASHGTPQWDYLTGWRWMLGLGAVPAAVFFLAMAVSPESPRFLIQSGHVDEGFTVLEHINGTDKARTRVDDIQDSIRMEQHLGVTFRDLFHPGLRRALGIGIFLAIANQAVGMNAISYYGPVLFKGVGFTGDTEFLAAACVGGVELVFTAVGMYLIDAVGRKRLMAVGTGLMTVFALGICYGYVVSSQLMMLVFVMLFTASFAFSMGPIPWLMIPELFPTFLRGRAVGICTAFLLLASWAVGQFTPMLMQAVGGAGTFVVFALLDVVCLTGVLLIVPETKDRTLEDIEIDWRPRTPQAMAQWKLDAADSSIRRAEATLARVENERMQALGIIEQAERDRVTAQKKLFSLQNEAMRQQIRQRLDDYQRMLQETALANEATVHLDRVPGVEPEDIAGVQRAVTPIIPGPMIGTVPTEVVSTTDPSAPTSITPVIAADATPAADRMDELNATLADVVRAARAAGSLQTAAAAGDSSTLPVAAPLDLPEPDQAKDEAELRRENAALRTALDSLDQLMHRN